MMIVAAFALLSLSAGLGVLLARATLNLILKMAAAPSASRSSQTS